MNVRYGSSTVLDRIDLRIARCDIFTIVGPNGSGKSTLLRTLIGGVQPSRGTVRRAQGLRLGYVPQRLDLDPSLPVTVGRFLGLSNLTSTREKRAALDAAGAPDPTRRQMAELSGGQF